MAKQKKCGGWTWDRLTGSRTFCYLERGHPGNHSDGCLEWHSNPIGPRLNQELDARPWFSLGEDQPLTAPLGEFFQQKRQR